MNRPISYHCDKCDSKDIVFDAVVTWNEEKQAWSVEDTGDPLVWCSDCNDYQHYRERFLDGKQEGGE